MVTSHVLTWEVTQSRGYETAWVDLGHADLRARGRAVGMVPEPYWVSYELETDAGFVTRELRVTVESADGMRALRLRRDGGGAWQANGEPLPGLDGALDCDLALCPLTNTMPVLRHRLHTAAGEQSLEMAWVSVPDLTVHASPQTYTHLGASEHGARVRFVSEDFRRDVEFDADGFVVDYPGLARRTSARQSDRSTHDQV
ncbi:putative glycolipid-binding domain-containing protein [Streptomyces sp. AM8-1-1]|uniref:putative glycolipid-binding domain-containing protein n=1 Tax=Streptomyces sp. AM8-1-1 TaxID=3075825 RepID=UPI0028C44A56|nr:putative glycolipid-binding domain-containing protein [Streptomyces sp. AM8-1-1]WNO76078.1 putative glycolipid-binding domain-containing protein [Streptomyces sp. AM8-1-1]